MSVVDGKVLTVKKTQRTNPSENYMLVKLDHLPRGTQKSRLFELPPPEKEPIKLIEVVS